MHDLNRYRVKIYGIEWDDGKGQYDVSDLPEHATIELSAADSKDALNVALDELSDNYGSLIQGFGKSAVREI